MAKRERERESAVYLCIVLWYVSPNSFCYRGSYFKSSLGVGDRGIVGFVAGGGCRVVSDCGCGWKVSRRMLLGLLLAMSMVVLDRRMGWEESRRVLGCRRWWSEGVLWKARVLLVGNVVGGG